MGLEPERGLRCKEKAVVQLLTWRYGDPDLANVANHHECLDTHCPLDVSQESIDDFRKLVGIPDTCREIKIKAGCLGEGDTYFLFCSSGGPSSFHSSATFLKFQLFLLAQGFKGCGQSLGVCSQKMQCARYWHWTGLMPVWTPLSPYLTATASLRRYILWYVWPPRGCGL